MGNSSLNYGTVAKGATGATGAAGPTGPAGPAGTTGYGTSLPGSPTDGLEYVLVDSTTSPTYQFRFRYNAGSANTDKWECVGCGGFLEGTTSITIPRAGVWYVEIGAEGIAGGSGDNTRMTLTAGGITLQAFGGGAGGGTEGVNYSLFDKGRMSGLTASQVLTPTTSGAALTRQYARAQPVRVS